MTNTICAACGTPTNDGVCATCVLALASNRLSEPLTDKEVEQLREELRVAHFGFLERIGKRVPRPAPAPRPPVCADCNDTTHVIRGGKVFDCETCPRPCKACSGSRVRYCRMVPCKCKCHEVKVPEVLPP